jgi:CubicO group peptidase (beta-lactamase class C family)
MGTYQLERREVTHSYDISLGATAGATATTAQDLANFWRALFTPGRLLSKKSIKEMQKTVPLGGRLGDLSSTAPRYGLGVFKLSFKPGALYPNSPALTGWWHGGDFYGYHGSALYIQGSRFNGTVLTSLANETDSNRLLKTTLAHTLLNGETVS